MRYTEGRFGNSGNPTPETITEQSVEDGVLLAFGTVKKLVKVDIVVVVLTSVFVSKTPAICELVETRVFHWPHLLNEIVIKQVGHALVDIVSSPVDLKGNVCSEIPTLMQPFEDQKVSFCQLHFSSAFIGHQYETVGKVAVNKQRQRN